MSLWNFSYAGVGRATGPGRFAVLDFFGFRVLGLAGMVTTQLERRVAGIYCWYARRSSDWRGVMGVAVLSSYMLGLVL